MSSEESSKGHRKIHLILTSFARILTAPVGRVWRLTHFYSVALLLEKWFACHHSFPYFFITIFPTAFSFRSRMTGRYLNCSIKLILAYLLTLIFVLSCLLTLAPFVNLSVDTFPCPGTAYVSYSFLLRQEVTLYRWKTQFTSAVILERRAESE